MSSARDLLSFLSGDADVAGDDGDDRVRRRAPLSERGAPPRARRRRRGCTVAPGVAAVDFAVRRRPHTSTRMLEVALRNERRTTWCDAEDVVAGRGVASRLCRDATPATRLWALNRALRACMDGVNPHELSLHERILCAHVDAQRDFMLVRYDAAQNLTPRVPYGVIDRCGQTNDVTRGEYTRMRRDASAGATDSRPAATSRPAPLRVAFELCCGRANVAVALATVVDVVFAIDYVDNRSEQAKKHKNIVFFCVDVHDWRENVDAFLQASNREWRVVFAWASPDCRAFSKILRPFFAREGAEFKEKEQSKAEVLVELCLDFVQTCGAKHWMIENCDGDLKMRRENVWDWVDDWKLLQTSQCKLGRADQKHTDLFMDTAMWSHAKKFIPPRCSPKRSPCAQLANGRSTTHRLTTQDLRGSAAKAEIHPGLAKAVARALASALGEEDA